MSHNILEPLISWVWFVFLGVSIYYFAYTTLQQDVLIAVKKLSIRIILPGMLILAGLNVLSVSLIFINPHQVGIVISMLSENGMRAEPIKSGKHWILPWFEKVVIYPIGLQTYTMSGKALEGQKIGDDSITARTKDGHEVHIDCSLTFQVDQKNVITLHEMWQDRYIKELIRPVLRSVIRNSTSQYSIGQVNSEKRLDLEKEFEEELKKLINQNGLVFKEFFLRNVAYSSEYEKAFERKQITITEAQAEAEAIIYKAKAEAEAEAIASQCLCEIE